MKRPLIRKSFLAALLAGGIVAPALADHTDLSGDTLLLHSRDGANFTSYFSTSDPYAENVNHSAVGANEAGSFWTSSHYDIVGVRSGAFSLDDADLGVTLAGLYEVSLTWGDPQPGSGPSNVARVVITHATGDEVVLVDQGATNNEWVSLGTFEFSGAAGEEIRIFNNGNEPSSLSGNIIYDSARLELIPEPSTYAAIFGGLALLGAFVYRRRLSAKK